jgi:tyrosine-protein kinase Etk/Wzc
MQEDNLYTYYLIIKKHIFLIVLNIILLTGMTAYSVFYLVEPIYEAEASILIPQKQNSLGNLFNNLGLQLPDIQMPEIFDSGKNTNNTADFISILKSRQMSETIIKELHMQNYKEIKTKDNTNFQAVIENFQKKVKIFSPSVKDNALRIKARFKNPELAKKIVNKYFYELKKYLEKNNFLSATRNRVFVENHLLQINADLKEIEANLLIFKKTNKTVSLPDEINEYIKYISDLEAQELKSKIELKEVSERIKVTGQKISTFNQDWQNVIKEMEISQAALKARKNILEDTKNKYVTIINGLPAKALILARLERELRVKNALYLFFSQQFEVAKLEEAKELEPFKILDSAYVSDKPVFPKKTLIIAVAFLISLLLSIFMSLFIEYWKSLKKEYQNK